MFGKMDKGTKTCNQRIDERWNKSISLADSLDRRLTELENNSRILVGENADLKKIFDELQIELRNTSQLVQENTGLKNELNDLQRKIKNLETKLGGLEKLQEEQEITLKKLEQDNTSLREFQSEIGNLEKKVGWSGKGPESD